MAVTSFYLSGVGTIPFHPDESTQLFNSGDIEIFWRYPGAVFWKAENEGNLRQLYRELDAPLTRNLLAFGRWITGLPAPQNDWDWSKTWQENQRSGALPSAQLLLTGRLSVAVFFPLSLSFFFLAARSLSNEFTAWVAVLLLASNSLVLLHTRRAMAESLLLFTTILTIWAALRASKHPWIVALPTALAFCAKQSLVALAPVGLLSVIYQDNPKRHAIAWVISQTAFFSITFIVIILLLNPFAWQQPIKAFTASVEARQELASAQTQDRPEQALNTPARKLIAMIGSLYLTPPIFAETTNYQDETREAEEAYMTNPLNHLFRTFTAGGLLFALGLFGFSMGIRATFKSADRRRLILLLTATILQAAALLALVPLPWQRYYMPLIPFSVLWTAYGINEIYLMLRQVITSAADNRSIPPGEKPDDSYTQHPRQ